MNNKGFTLAEVLITLGIIGVVATLTLPNLSANYQKKQTISKLKKTYSTLTNAFALSEVDNGPISEWENKSDIGATAYFQKYVEPYLKGSRVCTTYQACGYAESHPWQTKTGERKNSIGVVDNATDNRISFYLNDGTFISMSGGIYLDLNGAKGPNIYGKDFFSFSITNQGIVPGCSKVVQPTWTEQNIRDRCSKANNYDGACCAAVLIELDDWEMGEDYPW